MKLLPLLLALGLAFAPEAPEYLGLVARGLLWAAGHLNDDGTPARGYGPAGKSE